MNTERRETIRCIFAKCAAMVPPRDTPEVYHAVYSLKAALEHGSGIWLSTDGKTEVEVTAVNESREDLYKIYGWKDKVYVGTVTKRLRQGFPDSSRSWLDMSSLSVYLPKDTP